MEQTCIESGCERTDLYGRGLCGKHYQFYRYHGRLDEIAPSPTGRTCEWCRAPIKASLRQWAARFCSSRCAHLAKYHLAKPDRSHLTCEQCGESLAAKRSDARFCSSTCADMSRNAATRANCRANRKPCAHCGIPLPLHRRRFCSDACSLAHRRPEKYGLTRDELQAFLGQHEVCAICKTADWGRKGPQVDHCHESGAVRGVLCVRCNTMLGHAKDDPARLRGAAAYLARR